MPPSPEEIKSTAWWLEPKERRHTVLFQWVDYVARQTATQRADVRIFLEAVSNFNPTGNEALTNDLRRILPCKIRDNILRAGVDTVASLVSQARTSPQYLTTAAEWSTSRIAEKRSRVLQGQMYDLKVFDIVPRAFVDACESSTGYVCGRVNELGLPELERALPNEIYVDPEDGRYGDPNVVARKKFIARSTLLQVYGKKKQLKSQLLNSGGPSNQDYIDFFIRRDSRADMVSVVEAWRRPTVEGGDDGYHVICTDNCTLLDEGFKRRRIPVIPVMYAQRSQGYYGQSLVERMLPAQMRLSELDDAIASLQRLCSNSYWLYEENSLPGGMDSITNAPGAGVEFRGPLPPQLVTYTGTPPDLVEQRREIKSDIFDQEGLSQNATTGDVNKGLSSARAVRAADDTMVRRFISPARMLERAYLEVVRLIEDLNDDCAALDPEYAPKGRYRSGRRTWLKTSKWTDLALSAHDAAVQMFPISAQATTPQGKWSSVEEWVQAGFVSKPQAMDLMEFPDTEAFEALENANLDLVHEQVDNIIDLETFREDMLLPIPNQDLALAKYIANNASMVAFRLNAPPEVMDRFDAYLAYVKTLEGGANAANQNAAPAAAALDPNAAAAAQLAQAGGAPQTSAAPMAAA